VVYVGDDGNVTDVTAGLNGHKGNYLRNCRPG
jgi:hypothetical protein